MKEQTWQDVREENIKKYSKITGKGQIILLQKLKKQF
ncbi:hypothetical protein FUSNEC_GEN_294_01545 [Fusobacterium necrophorum subsp. funduliforme]